MENGTKRILCGLLMMAALALGPAAQAQQSIPPLPWGMTWDTTLEEYLAVLAQQAPGTAYSIREVSPLDGEGQYYVEHETTEDDRLLQYRAVFLGKPTVGDTMERSLAEVADKELHFVSLSLSDGPLPGEVWDVQRLYSGDVLWEFEWLSASFVEAFGLDAAYSFVRVGASGEGEEYFKLPLEDGSIDFAPIARHFEAAVQAAECPYWLVLGNGNASLRLYASTLSERDGAPRTIWYNTYHFSEKVQKKTPRGAGMLP